MKLAWKLCTLVALAAFVGAQAVEARAATAVGSIRGFIKDGQGNPLVGASVLVMTEAEVSKAKVIKKASTDNEGKFIAASLVPGRYQLKAEAAGFTPIVFAADVQPRKVIVFDSILMRRTGTLAEQTTLNGDSKYAARQAKNSIFHYGEEKPKADDPPVSLAPSSPELHGYVNAFSQTTAGDKEEPGSLVGANFAVSQQLGRDASVVMDGQVAHGTGATQHFEVLTTANAGDRHKLGLALGYARFTFSRHSATPHIGQFSLSAKDTWQVAGPVLIVYGLDFARFTEGASATSIMPRFGIAIDTGAKTRVFAGLEPGASVDEQGKVNLESGEIVFSQPRTVAFSKAGDPVADSSYRLQFGAEKMLSDKSSVELMAFFDTVSGHGVGLLAIPVSRIEEERTVAPQLQQGGARGVRVVYNRHINSVLDGSVGYAFGEGQQLDERGITDPAHLFSKGLFHIVSAKINANFVKTGTRISTVLRIAPSQAVFAIDPFQGQISTYDPNVSFTVTQAIPNLGVIPGQLEAVVDVRNLFDQQLSVADDRQQLVASRFNRLVRVGISMRF